MPIRIRKQDEGRNNSFNTQGTYTLGRVKNVILDVNQAYNLGLGKDNYDSRGTIYYDTIDNEDDSVKGRTNVPAKPFFSFVKNYPLKNELVLIIYGKNQNFGINSNNDVSSYYISNINIWNHPHTNPLPLLSSLDNKDELQGIKYSDVESGLVNKPITSIDNGSSPLLGEYFREKTNLKPLLPFEGDIILEGRFGNSIRFGSTNVKQTSRDSAYKSGEFQGLNHWSKDREYIDNGDPIIIIKNGQHEPNSAEGWVHTIEDINNDNSSIYLTSNQQISNFIPASLHFKSHGADLEEVKPIKESFTNPTLNETVEPDFEESENITEENEEILKSPPTPNVKGCTDPQAENYDESATVDDGSCTYILENTLIEDKTDNLKIGTNSNPQIGNTAPTQTAPEITEGLNQLIGRNFKLSHLISSAYYKPKVHPTAIYEKYRTYSDLKNGDPNDNYMLKDTLGFYIKEMGRKKLIEVKNSNLEIIYTSPGTISDDIISQIKISESAISGNYSVDECSPPPNHELYTPPYGEIENNPPNEINNYPGIDKDEYDESWTIGNTIVNHLKGVMFNCIDPIIEKSPFPKNLFRIKSGYRSSELTIHLGGTIIKNEHFYGQAIDFYIKDQNIELVWEWCYNNLESWHQLVLAYPEKGPDAWIHVSYKNEDDNKKFTTLISRDKEMHNKYGGEKRDPNSNYQDNIKPIKTNEL